TREAVMSATDRVHVWLASRATDGQLLRRFEALHEPAVFAGLLRRHCPMVMQVCHRLLANPQDAENAVPAVLFSLAKPAFALIDLESIAGWLHGVALRTALAKRSSEHRQR